MNHAFKATVDLVTINNEKTECALYLVENGPWENTMEKIKIIQERLYNTLDVAVDGLLADKYPESTGLKIRIQVDAYDNPPNDVPELVEKFNHFITSNDEYVRAVNNSKYISGLYCVCNLA